VCSSDLKNQEKYLDSLKYKQKIEEKHQEHEIEIEEKRQEIEIEEKHQEPEIEKYQKTETKNIKVRNQSRQNGVITHETKLPGGDILVTHESDPRAQATFDSKFILPTGELKSYDKQDGLFYTSDLYKYQA
jgi:hypothetical protein